MVHDIVWRVSAEWILVCVVCIGGRGGGVVNWSVAVIVPTAVSSDVKLMGVGSRRWRWRWRWRWR